MELLIRRATEPEGILDVFTRRATEPERILDVSTRRAAEPETGLEFLHASNRGGFAVLDLSTPHPTEP